MHQQCIYSQSWSLVIFNYQVNLVKSYDVKNRAMCMCVQNLQSTSSRIWFPLISPWNPFPLEDVSGTTVLRTHFGKLVCEQYKWNHSSFLLLKWTFMHLLRQYLFFVMLMKDRTLLSRKKAHKFYLQFQDVYLLFLMNNSWF